MKDLFNFVILKIFIFLIVLYGFDKPGGLHNVQAKHQNKVTITNIDEALHYYKVMFPPPFVKAPQNSLERIRMERNVSDDDLRYLSYFHELKKLLIRDSKKVTDNGLENIRDLISIEFLDLGGTNISIKGLQKLSKLKNVKYLSLDNTNITDDDLQILAELFPQLDTLSLSLNRIKGPGIQYLKKLPLGELYLDKTLISDATVKYFAGFKRCEISLHHTKVTEKGKEDILRITENCSVSIKEGDLAPLRE